MADSDRDHLLEDEPRPRRWFCCGHKRLALFIAALTLIAIGHGVVIYFLYFSCYNPATCSSLKVIALNAWGMPALLGSEYKSERMSAIADVVGKGNYDVFMLEELWMQADHEAIAAKVPEGFTMTGFRQLSLSTCDGRVAPWGCSGLAVVSRHNMTQVEFNSFTDHGDGAKAFVDGEVLAKKGVGRVRIQPAGNVTIDVFVTHTAADPDPSHGYNNSYYRVRQVRELMDSYVTKSDADIVILGGDFNAEPINEEGSPYKMVRSWMKNSVEEIFYKLDSWLNSQFATYGNAKNTFSGGKWQPVTYDYIFHRSNNNRTESWTYWFDLPYFKTKLSKLAGEDDNQPSENREKRSLEEEAMEISVSDHEGIESTIYFYL